MICLMSVFYFILSCDRESSAEILNILDEEYELYDYYVDNNGKEGIVAYIGNITLNKDKYPKDFKYVIVVSSDETVLPWGPMGELVVDMDSVSNIGLVNKPEIGLFMLQAMCFRDIKKYPAQNWCNNKNINSTINATSWRLPSWYEISHVFKDINKLNEALINIGGTLVDETNVYWTCQEINDNDLNRGLAYSLDSSQRQDFDDLKKNYNHVRAIKYLYYYEPN